MEWTPPPPTSFIYMRLDQPGEIRLLKLLPGHYDEPIRCQLMVVQLACASYEALSYGWGSQARMETVLVDGHAHPVTPSLHQALRRLRYADCARVLWADAVCINQADDGEKSAQVQRMRDVFAAAARVVVWLGEDRGGQDWAPLGRRLRRLRALDSPADVARRWHPLLPHTDLFVRFVTAGWFHRVWVVQEIVVACAVLVQRGAHSLPWADLDHALGHAQLQDLLKLPASLCGFVRRVRALRTAPRDPPLGLLALAHAFRRRAVSDERDRLYGLVGLLRAPAAGAPRVDYALSRTRVWRAFALHCIERFANLLVVALTDALGTASTDPECPSWCLDWTAYADAENEARMPLWQGRLLTDERAPPRVLLLDVGPGPARVEAVEKEEASASDDASGGLRPESGNEPPLPLQASYAPLGGLEHVGQWPPETVRHDDLSQPPVVLLWTRGLALDSIIAVGDAAPGLADTVGAGLWPELYTSWEALAAIHRARLQPALRTPAGLQRALHATVTAGAWPHAHPAGWRFWHALTTRRRRGREALAARYEAVRAAAGRGRRLLVTSAGRLGLGPAHAAVGDRVYALAGLEVLALLRDAAPPGARQRHHKLIGQAYVGSLMHYEGDARAAIKAGALTLERVRLC